MELKPFDEIAVYLCVCSEQLLPVVLLGPPQHAVPPVRLMLDLLEEVRRPEDAHAAGGREAWTQPQHHGTNPHAELRPHS